ncbi:MAG: NAD(P)H-dependent oxidoreductase [Oscillospiraceae bacterium]|nr:NAD(P)H-dependent oxidoreductase [Oscillospiraceae bacterium]
MKTLIVYYSYSGNTRKIAEEFAKKEPADIAEIKDVKRPGRLRAYTAGCFAALRGKAWPIRPLDVDFSEYDRLIMFSPVWAGNPPPAFNAILDRLPDGKTAAVRMVSASGKSGCRERLEELIKSKGCTLESLEDIKA